MQITQCMTAFIFRHPAAACFLSYVRQSDGVPALQLVEELHKAVKAEKSLNRDLTHKNARAEGALKEAKEMSKALSRYEKDIIPDLQVLRPTICQRLLTCC